MKNIFDNSRNVELKRSQIKLADYNPRHISPEGKANLKRSIKKYGVLGGIVVNAQTGNTLVGGHQKILIADEIYGYPETDYALRAELINVDEKTEKQINVTLNNPNVGGDWNYDKLRELIPQIDYKDVGLTDEDLSMIGCDFLFQSEAEVGMANELFETMQPLAEAHQAELESARQERLANQILEREDKIQAMKDLKAQVKEKASQEAQNMDAYIMISFSTYDAKASFCERFGYHEADKFIKGEDFEARLDGIADDFND